MKTELANLQGELLRSSQAISGAMAATAKLPNRDDNATLAQRLQDVSVGLDTTTKALSKLEVSLRQAGQFRGQ